MTTSHSTPAKRFAKPPPFLLGLTLLFWGWQSGFLLAAAIMAVIVESSRFVRTRWEVSEHDFHRVWVFCTLLELAVLLYLFANNDGNGIGSLFSGPAKIVERNIGLAGARAAIVFFRWLPMIFFLFILAQLFSVREAVPLTAISLLARWRRQREKKTGKTVPLRNIDISYPYFILCLFSASIHPGGGDESFFWGQAVLIAWALWPFRSRRSGLLVWATALVLVVLFGFVSQRGISRLQRVLENYNAQWIARLMRQRIDPMESITSIGHIGELKLSGQIVIRLHTRDGEPPPTYLRSASYHTYHQQTWFAGSRNDFVTISSETNQTTWPLIRDKTNSSTVNIACYLDGGKALLPLPTGAGRLENLDAYILYRNSLGAVMADGPNLVIFDADYGPGRTFDSPPDESTNHLDLDVPTNEVPALDKVISEMKLSGHDERQTLQMVYAFFHDKFTYSLWQGPEKYSRTNASPVTRFLLKNRSGHCEYFATATVLLLRQLKIPARYAVGYLVHERSGSGYVVRERDAHAWCLVWNEQTHLWENFDTTPPSWIAIEEARASPWQKFSDFWSWIGFQISKLRWGQSHLRQYILWGLIPVLLFLLYQIIFRRGRRRQKQKAAAAEVFFWPGLDSEFYLLERKLAQLGAVRRTGEPLSDWLSRTLNDAARADLRAPLNELLRLHYRYRFDPRSLSLAERETLTRKARACLEKLAQL